MQDLRRRIYQPKKKGPVEYSLQNCFWDLKKICAERFLPARVTSVKSSVGIITQSQYLVMSVKSSIGILTHQGHISKVNANDEY